MGPWANDNCYFFMSENYFKLKTVVLVINTAALPQCLKKSRDKIDNNQKGAPIHTFFNSYTRQKE